MMIGKGEVSCITDGEEMRVKIEGGKSTVMTLIHHIINTIAKQDETTAFNVLRGLLLDEIERDSEKI